jgi:hypothetical protein
VSDSDSDVWAGTHSVPVPDSTDAVDDALGVVTVLPPGVVVVVAPPVDVMLPVSDVAVLGVVAVVVEPTVAVVLPVVVVPVVALVPPGETAALHTGVSLGFVISTSVTTSWRSAGTMNAVMLPVPGSTVRANDTICSTGATAPAAGVEGVDAVVVAVAMVGVVWAPAAPAPSTTRAATDNLRVLRPIRGPPCLELPQRARKRRAANSHAPD